MAAHKTPRTLNDNLRLGRLTVPQWMAVGVGAVSLWLGGTITARVTDPNAHILAVALPTLVVVVPMLVFFRGGIERYPQQVVRYAGRRGLVYIRVAVRCLRAEMVKGGRYAAALTAERWATRRRHG